MNWASAGRWKEGLRITICFSPCSCPSAPFYHVSQCSLHIFWASFLPSVSAVLHWISWSVWERKIERRRRRVVSVHNWGWQCRCLLILFYSYTALSSHPSIYMSACLCLSVCLYVHTSIRPSHAIFPQYYHLIQWSCSQQHISHTESKTDS